EALYAFRKIGQRCRGALRGSVATMQILQPVGQNADFFRTAIRIGSDIGTEIGDGGKPVFQFCIEAVLRPARLKIEEAENERAGETEQRRRESRTHAGKRSLQARLQRIENVAGAARIWIERLNGAPDGTDCFQKAPECAEKAEKDQKSDQMPAYIPAFLEACRDGIENRTHGRSGKCHRLAAADQGTHGCKQDGWACRAFTVTVAE